MQSRGHATIKIATILGTRPEVIKLAPVLRELANRQDRYRSIVISTSQQTDLLRPMLAFFSLPVDYDLAAMTPGQSLNRLLSRIIAALDPVLAEEQPDVVLVQGDTTSALAGALAARYRAIAVGHIEAGLRTYDQSSPFPEELNRQLVSKLARYHFAPTPQSVACLLAEGITEGVAMTGNPVIDALREAQRRSQPSRDLSTLLDRLHGLRLIVLTTHRRESFGRAMTENLIALRRFVERHHDVALVFPVHPNPAVVAVANKVFGDTPRIILVPPLGYLDFIHLVAAAWAVASDSGGLQEEAPSLGKPLLVLRASTERPEAVACGVARLIGTPQALEAALDELDRDDSWAQQARSATNPFGQGDSARRIIDALDRMIARQRIGADRAGAA